MLHLIDNTVLSFCIIVINFSLFQAALLVNDCLSAYIQYINVSPVPLFFLYSLSLQLRSSNNSNNIILYTFPQGVDINFELEL